MLSCRLSRKIEYSCSISHNCKKSSLIVCECLMTSASSNAPFTILFIDYSVNWSEHIKKNATTSNGRPIVVEQAQWKDVHVEANATATRVFLAPSDAPFTSRQSEPREITVNLLVVRNFPKSLQGVDYRNILIGFSMHSTASINSLESLLVGLDRPLMYSQLLKIRRRLGKEAFPLIDLTYHANLPSGTGKKLIKPTYFPVVVKVSSTHAGYGKMRCANAADLDDLLSILALNCDYFTIEQFFDNVEFEFRLQQIGDKRRAFRRNSSSSWKNNWGNLEFADHEWQPQYSVWMDACSQICGGLDMFAIDVLHLKDGGDVILEMNDTAFGLMFQHEREDIDAMKNIILKRCDSLASTTQT